MASVVLQRIGSPAPTARQSGFTLVELITVLIVIGILGAAAAPKFFDRKSYDALAYANQVSSLIRYGQKTAIAQNRNVYVRLNGSSVALCFDSACANRVSAASGSNSASSVTLSQCGNSVTWACEGVPAGLAITAGSMFYFDAVGKPFLSVDTPPTLVSTFPASLTVTVTGDGLNHNTVVTGETGYVY